MSGDQLTRQEPPAGAEPDGSAVIGAPPLPANGLEGAIRLAQDHLLANQSAEGCWCAELEGDTILESEYILTMHFLGRTGETRVRKAAEYIRRKQLPQGGWAQFPGGDPEISASVKAYFVLKLLGDDPDAPHMREARRTILGLGGIEACNSFTKLYLAIFGQYDWEKCAAVPPEMMLLPKWLPFNIYAMSSWSRAIVVPLSIIWAYRPYCAVPEAAAIPELYRAARRRRPVNGPSSRTGYLWHTFFRLLDRSLKWIEHVPIKPLRRLSLRRAETWILERLEKSDGLAAIFPPMINTILALRCLGYPTAHPTLQSQIRELEKLEIDDGQTIRIQPCFSAVWDTALTLNALLASGVSADHPQLLMAGRWLLEREVREVGDWRVNAPEAPVGGWYFEYANEFYPDCDDTAAVLDGLGRLRYTDAISERRRLDALDRGVRWLVSMQNRDGGWAAFDRGCDRQLLTFIPFADHNAMIDPSVEDITGRTLGVLARFGFDAGHPVIRRAVRFLHEKQDPDGAWYGRWGCNYIYGTWLALSGLRAVGAEMAADVYQRAGTWIRSRQNNDGGWGESPRSYDDPNEKGRGASTATQTAWALMALFALGDHESRAVRRGVDYLARSQRADGSWHDDYWSGTGFPRVFYLRYHLYPTYFPMMALAAHAATRRTARSRADPLRQEGREE